MCLSDYSKFLEHRFFKIHCLCPPKRASTATTKGMQTVASKKTISTVDFCPIGPRISSMGPKVIQWTMLITIIIDSAPFPMRLTRNADPANTSAPKIHPGPGSPMLTKVAKTAARIQSAPGAWCHQRVLLVVTALVEFVNEGVCADLWCCLIFRARHIVRTEGKCVEHIVFYSEYFFNALAFVVEEDLGDRRFTMHF